MGAHMKFSRQDIHSLVFSNPEAYNPEGVICFCPTLIAELRAVENFCQMVQVFFFGTENRNGIELYHLRNTGKVFAFSGHEA